MSARVHRTVVMSRCQDIKNEFFSWSWLWQCAWVSVVSAVVGGVVGGVRGVNVSCWYRLTLLHVLVKTPDAVCTLSCSCSASQVVFVRFSFFSLFFFSSSFFLLLFHTSHLM